MVLMAQGYSVRETAEIRGVAVSTVKNELQFVYAKLGVKNRWAAFVALGWLTPPDA